MAEILSIKAPLVNAVCHWTRNENITATPMIVDEYEDEETTARSKSIQGIGTQKSRSINSSFTTDPNQ